MVDTGKVLKIVLVVMLAVALYLYSVGSLCFSNSGVYMDNIGVKETTDNKEYWTVNFSLVGGEIRLENESVKIMENQKFTIENRKLPLIYPFNKPLVSGDYKILLADEKIGEGSIDSDNLELGKESYYSSEAVIDLKKYDNITAPPNFVVIKGEIQGKILDVMPYYSTVEFKYNYPYDNIQNSYLAE